MIIKSPDPRGTWVPRPLFQRGESTQKSLMLLKLSDSLQGGEGIFGFIAGQYPLPFNKWFDTRCLSGGSHGRLHILSGCKQEDTVSVSL